MRYALMIEAQQGLSYAELLAIAQRAEAAGFEALFRSDHYESFPDRPADRRPTPGPCSPGSPGRRRDPPGRARLPGHVPLPGGPRQDRGDRRRDERRPGRAGLGAGWNVDEHRRHGFPFPPIEDRADMLEEQLAIVRGLWEEPDGWSFTGRHYRVEDAIFYPKPVPAGRASAADPGRWRAGRRDRSASPRATRTSST